MENPSINGWIWKCFGGYPSQVSPLAVGFLGFPGLLEAWWFFQQGHLLFCSRTQIGFLGMLWGYVWNWLNGLLKLYKCFFFSDGAGCFLGCFGWLFCGPEDSLHIVLCPPLQLNPEEPTRFDPQQLWHNLWPWVCLRMGDLLEKIGQTVGKYWNIGTQGFLWKTISWWRFPADGH